MSALRTVVLVALTATACLACSSDDDSAADSDDGGSTAETSTTATADDTDDSEEGSGGSGGAAATVSVSDGSSWEFTEILECEIGEDGSPDYRQFIGRTADGSAQVDIAYFPEAELAALSGVSVDAEVDGNDWTYSDSYADSGDAFDISLQPDGAEGSAPARVAGLDAPDADLTLDWSFTC